MDIILMILYVSILLGFLVFIHEGGHYLASRAFGVRVTEFMIGFPGPGIGFTKWGTKFGVTCVPLGGYVRDGAGRDESPSGKRARGDIPARDGKHGGYRARLRHL